jgi:hypothetical protein
MESLVHVHVQSVRKAKLQVKPQQPREQSAFEPRSPTTPYRLKKQENKHAATST